MVFTAKPVEDLPSFGAKLKNAREEAGLTKEKVSQLLSLPVRYVQNLEEEEIEKMPADVYAKGFLRKYAKLLALDEVELVSEYEKEARIVSHLKGQPHQALPFLMARRLVVTPKSVSWSLAAIVIFFIAGYFFYQLHFLLSPPSLVLQEPAQTDFMTSESLAVFKGQTDPGAKLTINGQQSYIDKDGKFEQTIGLTPGLNIISIEATNRFGKTSEAVRRIMLR